MIKNALIILAIILLATFIECCDSYICDSKILTYLLYLFAFIFGYKIMVNKKKQKQVLENYTNNKKVIFEDFIPSETFTGRKSGYVFKTGNEGTGYYLDG